MCAVEPFDVLVKYLLGPDPPVVIFVNVIVAEAAKLVFKAYALFVTLEPLE